jgi:hypothetical protein
VALTKKALRFIVVSVFLSSVVGGLTYWLTRPSGPQMTVLMKRLTEGVNKEFSTKIPVNRKVETVYVIVHGRGSRTPEEEFQESLMDTIAASDRYNIQSWRAIREFLEEEAQSSIWRQLRNKILGDAQGNVVEPRSIETASEVIKKLDEANYKPEIDGILVVDVTNFYEGPDKDGFGAKVSVEAKLWSKEEGRVVETVPAISDEITSVLDIRYLQHQASQWNWFLRFFLWFVLSCGLPWAGIQIVRAVVKRRNNVASMGLLIGFTSVDVALAWPLLASFGLGGGTVIALLLAAAAMGYYNYDAVEYINRRLL